MTAVHSPNAYNTTKIMFQNNTVHAFLVFQNCERELREIFMGCEVIKCCKKRMLSVGTKENG